MAWQKEPFRKYTIKTRKISHPKIYKSLLLHLGATVLPKFDTRRVIDFLAQQVEVYVITTMINPVLVARLY